MGTIVFESGVGALVVDAVDKILWRLPGRLSVLAVGSGALLGAMLGVSGGSIAILGKGLLPEMTKRGYTKSMSLGPIVAAGALATMIPPSTGAVIAGAVGKVSIGKLLIAIIMPGLLLALLFGAYIIVRCKLQPSLAPSYTEVRVPLSERLNATIRHILPLGLIVFAVTGTIFLGVATPSEASALGAIACYILAALYRKLNWQMIKKSAMSALSITGMVAIIITASLSFSKILAYSGAVAGLTKFATEMPVPPIAIIIATQVLVLILGCFMDPASIMMITLPIFIPIVTALGFNTLWYTVIIILNTQIGLITPPFGLDVYTFKAVAPPDVSIEDIFRSSMPFLGICLLAMVLIMVFPQIALWLPSVTR
jgi:tripartite ATP-independent transporter DctM subunit